MPFSPLPFVHRTQKGAFCSGSRKARMHWQVEIQVEEPGSLAAEPPQQGQIPSPSDYFPVVYKCSVALGLFYQDLVTVLGGYDEPAVGITGRRTGLWRHWNVSRNMNGHDVNGAQRASTYTTEKAYNVHLSIPYANFTPLPTAYSRIHYNALYEPGKVGLSAVSMMSSGTTYSVRLEGVSSPAHLSLCSTAPLREPITKPSAPNSGMIWYRPRQSLRG
ncbi:hypothetical protein ACRALDRAFT_209719 [Sodiomyces alcalophilus JCM 7366]|uniref:uncharacterized protein n=1 Tax=Sodiomyces alcalophilus JCM 7366 TaxID=591952 RepID=UPI0039B45C4D